MRYTADEAQLQEVARRSVDNRQPRSLKLVSQAQLLSHVEIPIKKKTNSKKPNSMLRAGEAVEL